MKTQDLTEKAIQLRNATYETRRTEMVVPHGVYMIGEPMVCRDVYRDDDGVIMGCFNRIAKSGEQWQKGEPMRRLAVTSVSQEVIEPTRQGLPPIF